MKTNIIAAAAVLVLAAAPAFAAEEYFTGPAITLSDRAPSSDTGSAQLPTFNGLATSPRPERMVIRSGSESEPESLNSQTAAYGVR